MGQATVYRGEDRVLTLRVTSGQDKLPYDLTDVTRLAVFFRQGNATELLEVNSDTISAKTATATLSTNNGDIDFTADNAGAEGNNIELVFDGVKDVDTVVNEWNTNNPTNTVSYSGDGTFVPSSQTIKLTGGQDSYQPVSVIGDPVLGKVQVVLSEGETNKLRTGPNQSIKMHIDKGTHPTPGERRVVVFSSVLNVQEGTI